MVMKRLDRIGVAQCRRDLRRRRIKVGGEADSDPNHFEKVATIVRPNRIRLDPDTLNQFRRVWRKNDVSNTRRTCGYTKCRFGHGTHTHLETTHCLTRTTRISRNRASWSYYRTIQRSVRSVRISSAIVL